MKNKDLKETLDEAIKDLNEKKLPRNTISFINYDNKYVHPKQTVYVEVCLKNGVKAELDISDWFKTEGE